MAAKKPDYPVVSMPCKRGSDRRTAGQSCKSLKAYRVSGEKSPNPSFKCVDCGFSWRVPLGGNFSL